MMDWRQRLTVLPDRDQAVARAAELIVQTGRDAIGARGCFMLALSGGSTPVPIFRRLAAPDVRGELDWPRVHVFWVDERCVPPDHGDSNFGMAHNDLLRHVRPGSIHRMRGEDEPEQAARAYEADLTESFGISPGQRPRFDLLVLGMGPDGHVASLFPGTPALHESKRLVAAQHVPKLDTWRITLTFPVLNAARSALVVVSGGGKRDALARLIARKDPVDRLPMLGVDLGAGHVRLLADADAAAAVKKRANAGGTKGRRSAP